MKLNTLMPGIRAPLWEEPGEPSGGAASEPPVSGDSAPEPAPQPDFGWVPEAYKDGETYKFDQFRADYDEARAAQAQWNERLSAIPADASGYDFTPGEMKFDGIEGLPEGFTVELLHEHEAFKPLFGEFAETLHRHGVPGEAAKDLMGLLGKMRAIEAAEWNKAGAAERAAIPNFDSRRATVERALDAKLSPEMATALKAAVVDVNGLKALEKLLSPAGPRIPSPAPAASGLDDLPAYERLKAARRAS